MGRVKNMIIDKHHEFEEDLGSLRKQLADKESEFINFELQQHLQLIWENVNEMKRRLNTLENNNNFKKQRTLFYVLAVATSYWFYSRK
jgi:hypothetical protein